MVSRPLDVVFLAQNTLLPLDNGGRIRNFWLARALARRHRVAVVVDRPLAPELVAGLGAAGLVVVALPKPRSRPVGYARALAAGAPPDLALQANARARAFLARTRCDVVLVGTIGQLGNLPTRTPGGPRVVVDTHNVEHLRAARDRAAATGARDRLRRGLGTLGMARYERRALCRADLVVACSGPDRDALVALGAPHVAVVANGVDLGHFTPAPPPPGPPVVAMTGDLAYAPNADAARWLARAIAPALRLRRPDARVLVAGRGAGAGLREELGAAGIEVRSPVPDMAAVLHEATAVVAPLRAGGGTRIKIIEAMAAGRPVVATRLGAEGLEVADGAEIALADGPEAIAGALAGLVGDPGRARAMGAAARRRAEADYSWDALGARLAGLLEEVAP